MLVPPTSTASSEPPPIPISEDLVHFLVYLCNTTNNSTDVARDTVFQTTYQEIQKVSKYQLEVLAC